MQSTSKEPLPTNKNDSLYFLWSKSTYTKQDFLERQAGQTEYQRKLSQGLVAKAEALVGTIQGQCVNSVEDFLSLPEDIIQGAARNLKTNSQIPDIGMIVKTNESEDNHVGVIIDMTLTEIRTYDSNIPLYFEIASTRWLDKSNPKILGYHDPQGE